VTDSFTIDLAERQVKLPDGRACGLAPPEWHLVELLTRHAGHLVPHDVVLTTLRGSTGLRKGYHLRTLMSGVRPSSN
jgi:two-component system KDP operon response regulator KdpE